MKEQRFAGLTLEQLNAAGAAAGSEALSKAHKAGLPSPGMTTIRLASGEEIKTLTRLHPNGTLEILDHRFLIFEAPAKKSHSNPVVFDTSRRWYEGLIAGQPTGDAGIEDISQLKVRRRKNALQKTRTKVAGG